MCYGQDDSGVSDDQNSNLKMELVVEPTHWDIPEGKVATPILIVWKITNIGNKPINFRARDLGNLEIRDQSGKILENSGEVSDGFLTFCARDYPIVQAGRTIFLPINTNLYFENGALNFLAETSYEGRVGSFIRNIRKGEYFLAVTYTANKPSEAEASQMLNFGVKSYWQGTIKSKTFEINLD